MAISDLPKEILDTILYQLNARDFLSLCATCTFFNQPSIRLDPGYWDFLTHENFQFPTQAGLRRQNKTWSSIYKSLCTQTRAFAWGPVDRGRLGHVTRGPRSRRTAMPAPMDDAEELGEIIDIQCGHNATTLLTSDGRIFLAGGTDNRNIRSPQLKRLLRFPPGWPRPQDKDHPNVDQVRIRQISVGDDHVLGLSRSGKIWSWEYAAFPGVQVKFFSVEVKENQAKDAPGSVLRVFAQGFDSSAYVQGTGICVWDSIPATSATADEVDTYLVDSKVVPLTDCSSTSGPRPRQWSKITDDLEVGAVTNWIMTTDYVVFVTDLGKVYASKRESSDNYETSIELVPLRSENPYPDFFDIQGSWLVFAIIANKKVTVLKCQWLDDYFNDSTRNGAPTAPTDSGLFAAMFPGLQNSGVKQMAFGDGYFLALHIDGTVTCYGRDLEYCGALGVDSHGEGPESLSSNLMNETMLNARGMIQSRDSNSELVPHGFVTGRRVWFDPEKDAWLEMLIQENGWPLKVRTPSGDIFDMPGVQDEGEVRDDHPFVGELSEWVEQQTTTWEQRSGALAPGDKHSKTHFVLAISAGAFHNAALVLVDDELIRNMKTKGEWWKEERLPRIKFSEGSKLLTGSEKEVGDWKMDSRQLETVESSRGQVHEWRRDLFAEAPP